MKKIPFYATLISIFFACTTQAFVLPPHGLTPDTYRTERAELERAQAELNTEKADFDARQAQIPHPNAQLERAITLIGRARDTATQHKGESDAYTTLAQAIEKYDRDQSYITAYHRLKRAFAAILTQRNPTFLKQLHTQTSSFLENFDPFAARGDVPTDFRETYALLKPYLEQIKELNITDDEQAQAACASLTLQDIQAAAGHFMNLGLELRKITHTIELPEFITVILPQFMVKLHGVLTACGDNENDLTADIKALGDQHREANMLSRIAVSLGLKKFALLLRFARLDMLQQDRQENVDATNDAVMKNLQLWMLLKTEAETSPIMPTAVKQATLELAMQYVLPKSHGFAADRNPEILLELAKKNEIVIGARGV